MMMLTNGGSLLEEWKSHDDEKTVDVVYDGIFVSYGVCIGTFCICFCLNSTQLKLIKSYIRAVGPTGEKSEVSGIWIHTGRSCSIIAEKMVKEMEM